MAIVYQKDKRSGITYAYESISFWDKEKMQNDNDLGTLTTISLAPRIIRQRQNIGTLGSVINDKALALFHTLLFTSFSFFGLS